MKTVSRIFLRDLKRIGTNWVAVVIALGVCLIPSLYAWVNILANWDPYNNTSTVPIAVVIQDEGADVQGMGFTNAGDMIRDQLKENTQLGWTFLNESEAMDGVKSGAYYAAFVIPKDFTASIADVLQGDTHQATIGYYVNEKVNAISPKVADTGSTTLESQIASTFVETVGKTVTDKMQGAAKDSAGKVDDATQTVAVKLRDAQTAVSGLADELHETATGIDGARGTVKQARDTLSQVRDAADGMTGTLDDALGGLSDARTKAATMGTSLGGALQGGSSALSAISSSAAYDIGRATGGIGWATGKLDAAIAQLRALDGTTQSLKASLETTRTTVGSLTPSDGVSEDFKTQVTRQLDQDISFLVTLSQTQKDQLDRLERLSQGVKQGSDAVANLSSSVNDAVQNGTSALADLQKSLDETTMPQVAGALDSFATVGGQLKGAAASLSPMLTQADASLSQLDAILQQGAGTIGQTESTLRSSADKIGGLADDTATIQSALTMQGVQDILKLDPTEVGSFMGTPVDMVTKGVYPVKTYGAGVAPFYTNLALWVGGFVLVAIYKLEVDEEGIGPFKPWQGFFGRGLLLTVLGQLQGIICSVGDLALGIQCLYPAAFVFAAMVQSFVYVSFVYAISVAFKHIGKAIGVLLVILQIPGTSGVYPIEMMPDFFQSLRPWLPFTYGINAMREAIAGFYGDYYVHNLLMLLLYLIPALLIGVTARRHLVNINTLFDKRLAETDMMIAERTGITLQHFRLATIIKVMMNSGEYRNVFLESAAKFELMYPKLVKRGFAALIWFPLLLLLLAFVTPHKFLFLMCWIASLVIICAGLIVIEYLHSRVEQKTTLADMNREELYALLDNELKQEFMAFAPIEKMKLDFAARSAAGGGAAPRTGEGAGSAAVPADAAASWNPADTGEGASSAADDAAGKRAAKADAGKTVEMPRVEKGRDEAPGGGADDDVPEDESTKGGDGRE